MSTWTRGCVGVANAGVLVSTAPARPESGPRARRFAAVRMLGRDRVGLIGLVLVVLAVAAATLGPVVAPYDPTQIFPGARLAPPSSRFWLGADELGRDLLSRTL